MRRGIAVPFGASFGASCGAPFGVLFGLLLGLLCGSLGGCDAHSESVEPPGYVVLPSVYDLPDRAHRLPSAAPASCTCAGAGAASAPLGTIGSPLPPSGVR